jgi:bacillithiol synthase
MNFKSIPLSETGTLSQLVSDYIYASPSLQNLYQYAPEFSSFGEALQDADSVFLHRKQLSEILNHQYKQVEDAKHALANIELLTNPKTYTVATAHQLSLYTGPLYFVYKILSAISLSQKLKKAHPQYNFIPVYWMGSEDHDFEEINHFHLYGKKVEWLPEQGGAVGRYSTNGMADVFAQAKEILGSTEASELLEKWNSFFSEEKNYGEAFFHFVNHLFGRYGLLVINQDNRDLKKLFAPVFKKDLTEGLVFNSIAPTLSFLNENYHVQATPREINVFYLQQNSRERIVVEDGVYKVNNTSLVFSQAEILHELQEHPEKFSPNVLMRPLYQQTVLPNIATIGGGGEVAYWLQLKDVFKAAEVFYPLVLLRDMAMILNKQQQQKMHDWNLNFSDIFKDKDELIREIVHQNSEVELSLRQEKEKIEVVFASIMNKALTVDKNLDKSVEAEKQKVLNSFQNLEAKLTRAEKKNQEQTVLQIERFKEKLFPEGILQERYDNVLPYLIKCGPSFFDELLQHFDLFANAMHIVEE